MKTLLMLTLLTALACSQPKSTVNGIPIPNNAFTSCDKLNATIYGMLREELVTATVITQEDLAEEKRITAPFEDPEAVVRTRPNLTVEMVRKAQEEYWPRATKFRKMEKNIDERIAQSDSLFKQYLVEFNQSVVMDRPGAWHSTGVPQEHLDYLQIKRNAFWKAFYKDAHRKARIVINEPTMRTCDLSEYGIR